jgi:hypothetical protein
MKWPAWLTAFSRRRQRRAEQQQRIAEAEAAARQAEAQWPRVQRAAVEANAFVVDMRRAMQRPRPGRP